MSNSTINCNLCTDRLVNEINERILARTMATGNVEVLISPRPQPTLYTRPLHNSIPPGPTCKPRVLKYNSDPKNIFYLVLKVDHGVNTIKI